MTKHELFIELSEPNKIGVSRWVDTYEFKGKYAELELLNGLSWGRRSSTLAKKYNVEVDKSITLGVKIDRIRLNGFNTSTRTLISQSIRADIKRIIGGKRCVVLGTNRSCDHKVEVDHKDGRKENLIVMNTATQKIEDFQPLSKPANDAKRQFCRACKETGLRYDAKLLGYTVSFVTGKHQFDEINGCVGCYWYDPVAFRQALILK